MYCTIKMLFLTLLVIFVVKLCLVNCATFPVSAALNVRKEPSLSATILRTLAKGDTVNVECQTTADAIQSGLDIWDRLADGGYVHDAFVSTGHSGFFPDLPRCGSDDTASSSESSEDERAEDDNDRTKVEYLARCIMSEGSVGNRAEQIALGFACQRNDNHAKIQRPSAAVRKLADDILAGRIADPTEGADHFYRPRSMPMEGESTILFDVAGGLEGPLPGLARRNWRPSWAKTCKFVSIPGVREAYFKFYKC